jgi:hypothetical protein
VDIIGDMGRKRILQGDVNRLREMDTLVRKERKKAKQVTGY